MKQQEQASQPMHPLIIALLMAGSAWALITYQPIAALDAEYRQYAWLGVGVIALLGGLKVAGAVIRAGQNVRRFFRAEIPENTHGTARLKGEKDLKKSGLLGDAGLFIGVEPESGVVVQIPDYLNAIFISPGGGGKGQGIVQPTLASDPSSMVVNDDAGELLAVMGEYRAEKFGHEIFAINPHPATGLETHRYNPLMLVLEAFEENTRLGVEMSKALAAQLVPVSKSSATNPFWELSAQSIIATIQNGLALHDPDEATLPNVYRTIASKPVLMEFMKELSDSEQLDGILAEQAISILELSADNPRQLQEFMRTAIAQLSAFDPSGAIAEFLGGSSFRFADLREKKATVFLGGYNLPQNSRNKLSGVLYWSMLQELRRTKSGFPVTALRDEAARADVKDWPEALTELRKFGLRTIDFYQSLKQIDKKFEPSGRETLMSQCGIQAFWNVRTPELAEYISKSIGNKTVAGSSFSRGKDSGEKIGEQNSAQSQPVIRPEEIMDLEPDAMLVNISGAGWFLIERVGIESIAPWRKQINPNPFYGNKPFIGKLRVKI